METPIRPAELVNYFELCHSEAEIKTRFRKLCFELHPDKGGSTAAMQELNAQYQARLRGEYRKTMSADDAADRCEMDARAAEIVETLVTLPGLVVELVGCWVWVTGQTFDFRVQLKEHGLKWASKKRAWYWHAPEQKCRGGKKSLEEIRAKYGSQPFANRAFGSALA